MIFRRRFARLTRHKKHSTKTNRITGEFFFEDFLNMLLKIEKMNVEYRDRMFSLSSNHSIHRKVRIKVKLIYYATYNNFSYLHETKYNTKKNENKSFLNMCIPSRKVRKKTFFIQKNYNCRFLAVSLKIRKHKVIGYILH